MTIEASLIGFVSGLVIGATGVGAGALMTPVLIGVFGLSLPMAIGTDLWFAGLTKLSGAVAHARGGNIDRAMVGWLLAGSLPTSLLALGAMRLAGDSHAASAPLGVVLAAALLVTAVLLVLRGRWMGLALRLEARLQRRRAALTVAAGALLGLLVTLSSVGAGAIGSALLLFLRPRLQARRLVGSDIAHAVPLTLVAASGHALLGHVDWALVGLLLVGSVPGIWLGAQLTRFLPDTLTRMGTAAALVLAAARVVA